MATGINVESDAEIGLAHPTFAKYSGAINRRWGEGAKASGRRAIAPPPHVVGAYGTDHHYTTQCYTGVQDPVTEQFPLTRHKNVRFRVSQQLVFHQQQQASILLASPVAAAAMADDNIQRGQDRTGRK